MPVYARWPRNSSKPERPLDPRRRLRAAFAREATAEAFGTHSTEVLDQDAFVDRQPGDLLLFSIAQRQRDDVPA